MQYVLAKEEYEGLLEQIEKAKKESQETINDLCVRVANNEPITAWPGSPGDPVPWGCHISKKHEWYCDSCPVDHYCSLRKYYSK